MELSGSIKQIFEAKQITASFKKREVVITTEEQYPQHIIIEFTQDKTSDLDAYSVGDKVTININIRGREWTNPQGEVKYFNSIQGWRITKLDATPTGNDMPPMESYTPDMASSNSDEEDDLPF